jgi:hypothetical protein
MNPNNYTTLEQSKKLKELGVQQEISEGVHIKILGDWQLHSRDFFDDFDDNTFIIDATEYHDVCRYTEWYAAFNLQEIFVSGDNFNIINIQGYFYIRTRDMVLIGRADEAQSMADAKIWELENKK